MSDGRYTEGVMGDGAAILKDGQPLTISEILDELNAFEEHKTAKTRYLEELIELIDLVHGSFGGGRTITFSDEDIAAFEAAADEAKRIRRASLTPAHRHHEHVEAMARFRQRLRDMTEEQ